MSSSMTNAAGRKKAGIRFDADFRYGGEIPVFDMGIILNNLLDNAIEACEKLEPGKGFIRLSLKRKEAVFDTVCRK